MDDDNRLEAEKKDLLEKIETLKSQIKNFEEELGISNEDLKANWPESDYRVLDRMKESEKQLSVIESLVKSETPEQNQLKEINKQLGASSELTEMMPELTAQMPKAMVEAKKIENVTLKNNSVQETKSTEQKPTENVDTLSKDLQSRTLELKQKSEQIAQISSLVSRLRTDMLQQPKVTTQLVQEAPRQSLEESQQPQKVKQASTPRQVMQYSAADLPALATMVQKLNELVKANESISEELREMINENKNTNTASRISDLVRKLASAGLNG